MTAKHALVNYHLPSLSLASPWYQPATAGPWDEQGDSARSFTTSAPSGWRHSLSSRENLLSIFMVSASEGWAVGTDGAIVHFSQGQWRKVASPTSYALTSISMLSSTDGWAVGPHDVLHYTDGMDRCEACSSNQRSK